MARQRDGERHGAGDDALTRRRQEILRRRLRDRQLADESPAARGITPRRDPQRAPLSFAQRRMWLHQQINPDSAAYNVSILLTLRGPVDRRALDSALAGVVAAHELLRTTYHVDGEGRPYQRIHQDLPPVLRHADPPEAGREALAGPAAEEAARPFDLAEGGPLRFLVVPLGDEELAVQLTVHHIVWDGLSFSALCRDLTELYEQARDGREPRARPRAVQYADFAEGEQQGWSEEAHADELAFWRERLLPLPPPVALPTVRLARADTAERADRVDRRLPPECAAGLRALAEDRRTTTFTVYLACYLLLLHRYSGASDITVGTTAMNREHSGVEGLVGNFGNTLALRFDLAGDPDFGELLTRVRQTCEAAYAHQSYPFDVLQDRLRPEGEAARPVLFDTLALFLAQEVTGPRLPGVGAEWRTVFHGASPFPLSFQAFLTDRGLDVEATYLVELFDRETVAEMVDRLGGIIRRAADTPSARVSELVALGEAERGRILARGGGRWVDAPAPLAESFAGQARRRPEATALVSGELHLRYRELAQRVAALRARLHEVGTGTDSVVAIMLPRSPDMVVAVLAVLAAGAGYVPVDPAYPPERARFMLADGEPAVVLTTPELAATLPEPAGRVVLLDGADSTLTRCAAAPAQPAQPAEQPERAGAVPPGAAAWVGYTSGSTGRPKAVVGSHAALASRVRWAQHEWPLADGEARLAKSSLTFIDGSTEILETLCAGGTVVLADDRQSRDGTALAGLVAAHGVRHLMSVPSLLRGIAATPGAFAGMSRVISTGEPLTAKLAAELTAVVPPGALANSYGCSELAGDVVAGPVPAAVRDGDVVPIGGPLPGMCAFVLDGRLRLVTDGVVGELYIGGPQLARGYLGHPGLTAERFVAHPFEEGTRLYRTGDLARWRRERLELVGRTDDQVKIRGNRVELGELAAVARSAPDVSDAAAVTRPGPGDALQLAVYVTPAQVPVDGVRAHLERALPAHLQPSTITPLAELPLLPNGKVDRLALPEPSAPARPARRDPATEAERALCAVVADVLERGAPSPDDDFFAAGGDSISAISLVAKAATAGWRFSVADVFDARTVAALARIATPVNRPTATTRGGGDGAARSRAVPLPVGAHRLRLSGYPPGDYLTSTWWRPDRDVTADELGRALRRVVARHDALRLAVDTRRRALWRASLAPADHHDAPTPADEVPDAGPDRIDELVAAAARGVDLAGGRVLHAVLGTGPGGPVIALAAHGLVVDEDSVRVLGAEIGALLRGAEPAGPGTAWSGSPVAGDEVPAARVEALAGPLRDAAPVAAQWSPSAAGPRVHHRLVLPAAPGADEIVAAWLYGVRRWLDAPVVVCDRVVRVADPGAVGPVSARYPLHVTGTDTVTGLADRVRDSVPAGMGYEALRYGAPHGARVFAGLPEASLLVGPGPAPAPKGIGDTGDTPFGYPARGLERLYPLAASYAVDGDATVLDVAVDPAAFPAGAARELLDEWHAAVGAHVG